MPELKKLHGSYESQGLVLIGIHCDPSLKDRDKLVSEMELPYPICQDVGDETQTAYKVMGYPTVYVIGKDGAVRSMNPDDLEAEIKAALAE